MVTMYHVYIIQSLKDRGYYVGLSSDVEKRLVYHNAGRVRSTKARTPFTLVYSEDFATRVLAREREKYLKSYKGSQEKQNIIEHVS